MHGLRYEYQDRINFVILDWDDEGDRALARELGIARHPAYGIVPPDAGPDAVTERRFGPLTDETLRALLDEAIAAHAP